jgi:hypothetical protein
MIKGIREILVIRIAWGNCNNLGVPRPEYDKTPKIYAQVTQEEKDLLEDIRAFHGFKHERQALLFLIEEYHKRHKVPPSPMRKKK